ncbi:hypothetical protein FBEOM_4611 [Fusarium beomiforme]|uniref:Uncharacterized protein n=1 Tax=Fusarium beomiforme TaxID=44412 RepID=A0A9P5AMG9_9HYPO|nr:hypothetical protein FBEOM_4611 [Fusarium beomiforme]
MNAIVDAANDRVKTLWAPIMQWSSELNIIKSPGEVYEQKREVLRARFDNELRQLMHHQNGPNEYQMRSDALLKHAGELKELEIQFKQTVALMERDFEERLEAAHTRLACGMLEAFGDALFDPSVQHVLSQRLAQQNSAIEVTAQEQPNKTSKRDIGLGANPEAAIEGTIHQDRDNMLPHPGQDSYTLGDQMLEQISPPTEARALAPAETCDQQQSTAQPMTPVSASTPSQRTDIASKSRTAVGEAEKTGSQTTQAPTPTEESQTSETIIVRGMRPTEKAKSTTGRTTTYKWKTEPRAALRASAYEDQTAPTMKSGGDQNSASLEGSDSSSSPPNSLIVHLRAPLKRLQTTTTNQPQKRQRVSPKPPTTTEERTIQFDQVYQNGNAKIKFIITEWPPEAQQWYILECREHNTHFIRHPIIEAAQHLAVMHGMVNEYSLAVKMLGTRVLNCSAKLAAQNNTIAKQAFDQNLRLTTRIILPENADSAQRIEVIPVVGEIYATNYPNLSHTYPILVIPWSAFDRFVWREKLLNETPSCYLFQKKVDQYPRGWAKGYEDGGPLFKSRKYPVIYFDKSSFPDRCNVGWVPILSFRIYDPNNTDVVHTSLVYRYLRYQDFRLTIKDPRLAANRRRSPERCIIISDDSDGEDTNMGARVKREDEERAEIVSYGGQQSKHVKLEDKERTCEADSGNQTHQEAQQSTQVETSNWIIKTAASYASACPENTADTSHLNPQRHSQPTSTATTKRPIQGPCENLAETLAAEARAAMLALEHARKLSISSVQ